MKGTIRREKYVFAAYNPPKVETPLFVPGDIHRTSPTGPSHCNERLPAQASVTGKNW